jgi:acetyl-CoA carboxylase biotin carboxyl carrier protein
MAKKKAKKVPASRKRTAARATPAKKPPSGLLADVQNLIDLMVANDVSEADIQDGQRKIALKRGPVLAMPAPATPFVAAHPAAAPEAPPPEAKPAEDLVEITSPMVGTFYAAPSPDSEPYVEAGARINGNTVVCIVEAMKVMNEIKAECSGTIEEVCVQNASPVEFGQVLFRVKPA